MLVGWRLSSEQPFITSITRADHLRLQREQNVIEILKNIVKRARRVIDQARNFASREADQSVAFNNRLGRLKNALPQLFGRM